MGKLVICAHGIGDHAPDFAAAWEPLLRAAAPNATFDVAGLHWDDLLDQARDKYLATDPTLERALAAFGITMPDLFTGEARTFLNEFVHDVVAYCALGEMRKWILAECTLRLARLAQGHEADCVLLGHSLGAALLTHLAEMEFHHTTALVYRGLLLFGHPLGIESALPAIVPDPLSVTPHGQLPRTRILQDISGHWGADRDGRLALIENTNDVVCADVKMAIGGGNFDPIPVRQSFTTAEMQALASLNPTALQRFTAGQPALDSIVQNHAVATYAAAPAFAAALGRMLA